MLDLGLYPTQWTTERMGFPGSNVQNVTAGLSVAATLRMASYLRHYCEREEGKNIPLYSNY
jgi:hypothetical protein